MSRRQARAAGFLLACILCSACGYVGDVMPPALNIAMPVRDLRAVEYGDTIVADFTIAPLTTEGLVLTKLGTVDVSVGIGPVPFNAEQWAATASRVTVNHDQTGPVHVSFPAGPWVGKEVVIGARVVNPKGRASDWSNFVALRILPPIPAPVQLVAEPAPAGVRLKWQSTAPAFRVFRRGPEDKEPVPAGNTEAPEFADTAARFGVAYQYLVQAVNGTTESVLSAPVAITPTDIFPPAVPAGLSAVAGTNSIELVWERNTDADLRGYRVYRAVAGGKFQSIAELVETPAYSDRQIESATSYRYAIAAVDLAGNESKMSAAVEIAAP